MDLLQDIVRTFLQTLLDIAPIAVVIFGTQLFVIRRPVANIKKVMLGFFYVVMGMSLFLIGLEKALFPLGKLMAEQLTNPDFIYGSIENTAAVIQWSDYKWVYLFAAAIGFSTAIAEPSLIAVAMKANDVSGGAISAWGLRVTVGLGVATGLALGTFRIVTGLPLHYFIITAYVVVLLQTIFAPRLIIPLAYDSGGVTTSTVTVPLVAALGIGLASTIPGRSTLLDGFGLIAFACLFPIMSVMGYAQFAEWRARRNLKKSSEEGD